MSFATGNSDMTIRIWEQSEPGEDFNFILKQEIKEKFKDLVRSVDWAKNIGLQSNMIAACSEDGLLAFYKSENGRDFEEEESINLQVPLWKVSWSPVGHMLAVSTGENKVIIYKKDHAGKWKEENRLSEEGVD